MPEEEPEATNSIGVAFRKTSALFSPEGIIMLPIAIFLDLVGIILICFGLDDFGITDIIGVFFISGWMYLRSGQMAIPERLKKRAWRGLKKIFRGRGRFLTPIIGEAIPYLGVLPFWTLAVYFELTS